MYKLIRPILFKQDPEKIHGQVVRLGKGLSQSLFVKLINQLYGYENKKLHLNVFNIDFKNPVGLAAGFDKNGELLDFMPSFGFGFVEIGSVTAKPGRGNTKPRIFRLPEDGAVINRMGLNNEGADKICERLMQKTFKIPIGVNIAKTHDPQILDEKAIDDFCYSFKKLYCIGDYLAINISCPNTKEGKTFENKESLKNLLFALKKTETSFKEKMPVLLKLSPDLSYKTLDEILEVSEQYRISGFIISNTSLKRTDLQTNQRRIKQIGEGGLSGLPIREKATEFITYTHSHIKKAKIIGVGGIFTSEDAYKKIKAGASLIQIYTGLIFKGPSIAKQINRGLVRLLERDGFSSISEAVGMK